MQATKGPARLTSAHGTEAGPWSSCRLDVAGSLLRVASVRRELGGELSSLRERGIVFEMSRFIRC